jgi:hypothetical protein
MAVLFASALSPQLHRTAAVHLDATRLGTPLHRRVQFERNTAGEGVWVYVAVVFENDGNARRKVIEV